MRWFDAGGNKITFQYTPNADNIQLHAIFQRVFTDANKQNLITYITSQPNDANLNDIDVSAVTNFSSVFQKTNKNFHGDVSGWDVTNVTDDKTTAFLGCPITPSFKLGTRLVI